MRKIIMQMSVSLDGYFEGPDREIDWHLVDEELHLHMNERLKVMGGFLSGRVSHELMAAYWPTADADPQSSPAVAEFAGIWRDMPKFVYSRTLERADWNATIVRDVVAEEVRELKARPGGDLVLGGAASPPPSCGWAWSTSSGSTSTPSCWGGAGRPSPTPAPSPPYGVPEPGPSATGSYCSSTSAPMPMPTTAVTVTRGRAARARRVPRSRAGTRPARRAADRPRPR